MQRDYHYVFYSILSYLYFNGCLTTQRIESPIALCFPIIFITPRVDDCLVYVLTCVLYILFLSIWYNFRRSSRRKHE
jgi:hypothetical protein